MGMNDGGRVRWHKAKDGASGELCNLLEKPL